jgi:predicted NAD/FAD-binding protein
MNNLQGLPEDLPLLVTLNPGTRPEDTLIHDEHVFTHPIFDEKAISAQRKIPEIQGQNGIWFCGAYQRYGFHEDGLLSAVRICEQMGVPIPWH